THYASRGHRRTPMAVRAAQPAVQSADLALSRPARGLWSDAWRRLRRNQFALAGGAILILLALAALAAPVIAPYSPIAQDYDALLEGPSPEHIFGTDNFGRDIFSRILYGGRISLTVSFLGTLLGLAIGILLGILSGYYSGWVDQLL